MSSREGREIRAVVTHDFMETYGGAERITAEIAHAFPQAPVVAILGRASVAERMGVADRFISLLPPRPAVLRHYRLAAPIFPALVDRLRVSETDVVISSSYAFAHRLRARNDAPRVCYCHSPLRFAWEMPEQYRDRWATRGLRRAAFEAFTAAMRRSDRRSAQQIARYWATGPFVAEQIERFYGRRAEVIAPPIDCSLFRPGDGSYDDFWLFCGRLIEPYKKVTALIEAFNDLGERLVVAGDGPERELLERLAGPNVEFRGMLGDDELIPLMQRCKAAVFPSQDDFGLVPIEVNGCGRPVLAYAGGGALGTVAAGVSGELFGSQTAAAIIDAVRSFRPEDYDPNAIREHALQWDAPRFRERIVEAVLSEAG